MAAIYTTFQNVIDRARLPINDGGPFALAGLQNKARYTDDELLTYLNDGLLAMVGPRADLFVFDGTMNTVANTINQTLPAGGISVMDVYAAAYAGSLRGVLRTTFDVLRSFRQTWRTDAAGICQNWLYAPEDVTKVSGPNFMIYPQSPNGQVLNLLYTKVPVPCTTVALATAVVPGSFIPVADTYSVPLAFYVAGRAEIKDDEHADSGRAEMLLKGFLEQLQALNVGEDASP